MGLGFKKGDYVSEKGKRGILGKVVSILSIPYSPMVRIKKPDGEAVSYSAVDLEKTPKTVVALWKLGQ